MKINADNQIDQQRILIYLLLLFYLVYLICAVLLQIKSHKLPSKAGSVFDVLTGSLLMMISMISILIVTQRFNNIPKLFLWLGVSVVAGALAIDEWFEFHEKTRFAEAAWWAFGDDDYIKIALWFCAGLGIYILHKIEKFSKKVLVMFLIGFLFQSVYLVIDMGDGDFFTLPFSKNVLIWAEEIMELISMQSYLASILLFHQKLYMSSKDS